VQFTEAKTYITRRMRKELPKHLSYHSIAHIKDVYDAARKLAKSEGVKGDDLKLILIAAMYHDCGFIYQAEDHEKVSCEIAREVLPDFDFSAEQIDAICGMIMATRIPQDPRNHLEEILCDADLDYLGRDDFFEIGDRLHLELRVYGIVNSEKEWNQLQIKFLEQHRFFTKTAIALRKAKKKYHLIKLKESHQ
jgi:uncharacterized protein